MNRRVCLLIAGLFGTALALAQPQPPQRPPTPAKPVEPAGPQGEQKLRWVCRQLKLDDKQMQQAEALIAAYHAELKDLEQNTTELLQRIQDKAAEMQAARTAGDTERTRVVQEELRNLAPSTQAENHFFDSLQEILTAEQKDKLPVLRKRAEVAGDISLRPVHVLRAVRKLALTADQERQLEKILDEYRTSAAGPRGEKPESPEERVEQFIKNVRALLTPQQVQAYDREIAALRENPPTPTPFPPPGATTQPTGGPSPASNPPGAPPGTK